MSLDENARICVPRTDMVKWRSFSKAPFMADEALLKLLNDYEFDTVLDVGCGEGLQSRVFALYGKKVVGIDCGESVYFKRNTDVEPKIVADFNTHQFSCLFDCLWCSHVLEHQLDTHKFLTKVHSVLKEDGVLAITIPPAKSVIVGGHVSLWNAGLLLYRLVLAGFDCREASVLRYGYNISVIIRKRSIPALPPVSYDAGDISLIRPFLPATLPFSKTDLDTPFNGDIVSLNWDGESRGVCETVPFGTEALQAEMSRLEDQIEQFQAFACDQRERLSVANEELVGLRKDLVATQGSLRLTTEKLKDRTLELTASRDACVRLQSEYGKMQEDRDRIKANCNEAQEESERAHTNLAKADEKLRQTAAKLAIRAKQLKACQAVSETRRAKLAGCFAERIKLKNRIEEQKRQIVQLKETWAGQNRVLNAKQAVIDRLQASYFGRLALRLTRERAD